MKAIDLAVSMTDEEYFLFEERSILKHELINGILYEMSGESTPHNEIAGNIFMFFKTSVKGKLWKVFFEGVKVQTPEKNYFYPDIFVCSRNTERYYSNNPILIAEVLSYSTKKFDLTDKFIQYQKIETLQYYLCVEPEQQVVIFNFKNEEQEWIAETYTKKDSVISLPKIDNIQLTLNDIYQS